jgi:hypothetical protein
MQPAEKKEGGAPDGKVGPNPSGPGPDMGLVGHARLRADRATPHGSSSKHYSRVVTQKNLVFFLWNSVSLMLESSGRVAKYIALILG